MFSQNFQFERQVIVVSYDDLIKAICIFMYIILMFSRFVFYIFGDTLAYQLEVLFISVIAYNLLKRMFYR